MFLFDFSSFTVLQHLAIWGNLLGFYIINLIVSAIPSSGMYTIMFRLCKQPSYWITMFVSLSPMLTHKTISVWSPFLDCCLFFADPNSAYLFQLIVVAGMGPIVALKYFRFTYRPSKINLLQQAERLGGPILSLGNIEPQTRSIEKEVAPLSISHAKSRSPVFEPLLSDSPNSTRKSFGPGTPFDFFQSQGRLSSSYLRNCKNNWFCRLDESV